MQPQDAQTKNGTKNIGTKGWCEREIQLWPIRDFQKHSTLGAGGFQEIGAVMVLMWLNGGQCY